MGTTERIIILGSLLVLFIATQILIRVFRSKKMANVTTESYLITNIIKQPKLYLFTGILGIIIFTAIGFYFIFAQKEPLNALIMILAIPYIPAILLQANWKIEVKETGFIFQNMWGIKREFIYDEIEVRKFSRCTRFYKNGKHIVGISYIQDNWDCLERAIIKYRKNKKIK